MSVLRALGRMAGVAALCAALLPAQILIAGPLFKDRDTLPNLLYRGMTKVLGINIEYSGGAIEKNRPMIYYANHQSYLDPIVTGNFLKGAIVAMEEISHWPVIGGIGRALGLIYVKRDKHGEFMPNDHAREAKALNSGRNIVVFPEAGTTDGSNVKKFKNGILTIMFNNTSNVPMNRDVRVQPFAINVKRVNGEAVNGNQSLRDKFAWYGEERSTLAHLWNLLNTKSIDLEVKILPVMDPHDYPDRQSFAAAAETTLRNAVVCPSPPP